MWMYYFAIVIDPILRFNWIFYAALHFQLQHSAVTSFFVAFSEVFRRGLWSLFRVENEHCSNVGHFRASRDVPLPYELSSAGGTSTTSQGQIQRTDEEQPLTPHLSRTSTAPMPQYASGADVSGTGLLRRRASDTGMQQPPGPMTRGLQRIGTALRMAHNQDFEKKRKPELGRAATKDDDSDDDDDYDGEHSAEHSTEEHSIEEHSTEEQGGDFSDRENAREIERVRSEVDVGRAGPAT